MIACNLYKEERMTYQHLKLDAEELESGKGRGGKGQIQWTEK